MLPKDELRKDMLEKRNSMPESERKLKSAEIIKRLFALDECKRAQSVGFYLSKGSEVETLGAARALASGKEIVVPHTDGEIELVKFHPFEDLVPGKYGIPEPKTLVRAKEPDIIISPGLAFDLDCHRLGYGKGNYDRLLKKIKSIRIGICFDFQVVESLPRHEHDERMGMVITEKRVIRA